MADRWMTPYYRDPFYASLMPYENRGFFGDMDRFDRAMDRMMANTMNWANKSLTESHMFAEPCPEVVDNDKEFRVKMDVSHFAPNELKVSVKDHCLQVEGKHEEKNDKYGTIQRSFIRKYTLPKGMKEENVTSELSKDGMLTVGGSKMAIEDKMKTVPIEFKG